MKKLYFILLFLATTALNGEYSCVFAHGIVDGPSQLLRFQEAIATPTSTAITFPDAYNCSSWGLNSCIQYGTSLLGKHVNRNAMHMGQGPDITTIHDHLKKHHDQDSIILYGCSRGAAALMTYLGTYNPTNIAALVLDACPTSMPDTIKPTIAKLGIHPEYAQTIFSVLFPGYDSTTALTPYDAISNIINKDLPILLIHSQRDSVVHITNTFKLYQQLIQQGFTHVHLAILPSGKHSFVLQDPTIRPAYLTAVHSFYKQYNLPHDINWAQAIAESSKPSLQDLMCYISKYDQSILHKYHQARSKQWLYAYRASYLLVCYSLIAKYCPQ